MPKNATKQRLTPHLTLKQKRFVQAYARHGNGTQAARDAGYSQNVAHAQAYENLNKPYVLAAAAAEIERRDADIDFSSERVRRRLDRLSHGAEAIEQFATAVRAEELIGKAAGMFIDQSVQLTANVSGDHLAALLEVARQRQAQPLDLARGIEKTAEHRVNSIMENVREKDK